MQINAATAGPSTVFETCNLKYLDLSLSTARATVINDILVRCPQLVRRS